MPYVKNVEVFHCPSASGDGGWQSKCVPGTLGGRPQNNIRNDYGFHEIINNGGAAWDCAKGCHHLSRLIAPSETVIIADCQNNHMSPWARIEPEWINPRVAFANYSNNGDIACGCPASLTVPLQVALDRHARHSDGAVLVFADGHAKWYNGGQIKSRAHGGTLRICGSDLCQ